MRLPLRPFVLLLALLLPCGTALAADQPGQADLDAAIDAKLASDNFDDFGAVLELCQSALKKGLDEEGKKFAADLYTGTLMDRASMVVEAIFDGPNPDPQWQRMRDFAMRDLDEAIDRDPQLGAAWLMIARLQSLPGGDRKRADEAADKAIDLGGDDKLLVAQAHVIRGNLRDDDKAARAADYDKAVELAPRDKDVRRTRGLFHLLNDEFDEARADLAVAIEEDADDVSLREALGMAYMMENKLDEAQQAFDKAIEIDPDAPNALLQRARVLALKGEQPKAIADLDKAIELDPDDAIPLVLRARIHQQAGNTDQAQADLESVLRRRPDHPAALELRGLIAAERNDYPAAIRDFRKLVGQHGDDALLVGQLGMLYLAAKQPREAIKRFTRALELDDKQFLSRRGRSDALISIGDHTAALADLEAALALDDDNDGVLNNLAWLLATSPDDALRDGKRAIELATKACEETEWKQAHIISTLAAGYAETGDFAKAREYSKKAVETGSESPEVKAQLQKELASYEAEKAWRERQELAEAKFDDDAGELVLEAVQEADDDAPAPEPAAEKKPRRPFDE